MILHPAILALYASSLFISFMVLYSAFYAGQILTKWDIQNGSEEQLALERRTYLISTLLTYVFGIELLSFFLFIFTADQLHTFFTGAMCAAGSLFVNPYGYPTLLVRTVNFILVGIWLVVNHVDTKGYDYPLIRKKYGFFLCLVPLIILEGILQANYFIRLEPNIITSCCGTLFSTETTALPSELKVLLLPIPTMAAFYGVTLLISGIGLFFLLKGKGGYLFSGMSGLLFIVSVVSIISFISVYIYELPTHHCPFCIIQKEYGFIGYLFYTTLFGAAISGMGVGALMPFRNIISLAGIIPSVQRKLALSSMILFLFFAGAVTACILLSNLSLAM